MIVEFLTLFISFGIAAILAFVPCGLTSNGSVEESKKNTWVDPERKLLALRWLAAAPPGFYCVMAAIYTIAKGQFSGDWHEFTISHQTRIAGEFRLVVIGFGILVAHSALVVGFPRRMTWWAIAFYLGVSVVGSVAMVTMPIGLWIPGRSRERFHIIGAGIYLIGTVLGLSAIDRGFSLATVGPGAIALIFCIFYPCHSKDSIFGSKEYLAFIVVLENISVILMYLSAGMLMAKSEERNWWTKKRFGCFGCCNRGLKEEETSTTETNAAMLA